MSTKLTALSGLIMVITAILHPLAVQGETPTPNYVTTNDLFDKAYFRYDKTFYENNTFDRQVTGFIGSGKGFARTFTDNEIINDGELLNIVYRDVLVQQSMNDPYLRTPDLPNPYDSSLLMSPRYNANKLRLGTEYRFDNLSPR